jgi:hypothetical protein
VVIGAADETGFLPFPRFSSGTDRAETSRLFNPQEEHMWFGQRKRSLVGAGALLAITAAAAAIGTPAPVLAKRTPCGDHTLRGSYIFAASGFNIAGGVAQPKAIIEALEFNGDGTLTVPAVTVSINGAVTVGAPGSGVYTLDAECRGTLTFTPGPSFSLFTEAGGKEAWMIQTNQGTVFQGTVTKLSLPAGNDE